MGDCKGPWRAQGVDIYVGTWPPVLKIFTQSLEMGKFDESRKLLDGSLLEIKGVYPLDAAFDKPEDVPAISKKISDMLDV